MRLLLLPGMDGTGRLFQPLLAALPPEISAIVVSYPVDRPLGYDELLPLVEVAVPAEPFVVMGESFSGPLALMLASRHPPGLKGVVLCASFVRFPLQVSERWRDVVRPWMFRWQPTWLLAWVLLGRRAWGPLGRALRQAVRSVSPDTFAARARAVARVDVTCELGSCHVPILYLRASDDMVVRPGNAALIAARRPDAEVVVLPGPHLLVQSAPHEVAAILTSWCERRALS